MVSAERLDVWDGRRTSLADARTTGATAVAGALVCGCFLSGCAPAAAPDIAAAIAIKATRKVIAASSEFRAGACLPKLVAKPLRLLGDSLALSFDAWKKC
jgi:TctA family transporter